MAFIAGGYTCTWNSLAVGQTADGYRLSHSFFKRLITGDSYGQAPQDGIYQGAECFLAARLIAYSSAALPTIMWPYHATFLNMGVIGTSDVGTSLAKAMVLTNVSGTTASAVPATLTLTLAILAEGFPVELLFAPDLREVPLRMRVYPSSGIFGTQT